MVIDKQNGKNFKVGRIDVKWDEYLLFWKKVGKEQLPGALAGFLLLVPVSNNTLNNVISFADKTTDEAYIKSLTILIMELPEYQLS